MTYTTTRYDIVSSTTIERSRGHTRQRGTRRRCRSCGSENLRYTPKPLWEKGRGEQRTPTERIDAYACNDCGEADVVVRIGS